MSKLSELAAGSLLSDGAGEVWMHVYDLDPYTGWANEALMRDLELGVYHCGVEVYGTEWSFQYMDNAWEDSTFTGVTFCTPKQEKGFIYRESVRIGVSSLSRLQISHVIRALMFDWRANTYHLTRKNCLHFSEALISELCPQVEIPAWIKNLCDATKRSRVVDYIVDSTWSFNKQLAIWKHRPRQPKGQRSSERYAWWDIARFGGRSCAKEDKENTRRDPTPTSMPARGDRLKFPEPVPQEKEFEQRVGQTLQAIHSW
jgi:hypothetical protein